MVSARHERLEWATKDVVSEAAPREHRVGTAHPRDLDEFVAGEKEQVYDVVLYLFRPEKVTTVTVEATHDDGEWVVETV